MSATAFTAVHVAKWDVESVAGWLRLLGQQDLVEAFREHDISGEALLEIDDEMLHEMGIDLGARAVLMAAITVIKNSDITSAGDDDGPEAWSDSDDEGASAHPAAPGAAVSSGPASPDKSQKPAPFKGTGPAAAVSKKSDPLRMAAANKAVGDLTPSTVISGFLWKVGGSGLKPKHWKRRFFVLTDDNCLYYFKSPKDLSALGLILLPSYTVTTATKSEAVAGKPFAFKVFNREHGDARKYIFAAESLAEMKTWMNVMSLASIAFGTGEVSRSKASTEPQALTSDGAELSGLKERAGERAGGVVGSADPAAAVSGSKLPSFLKSSSAAKKKTGGPQLCLVTLLDGTTVQLYAEEKTTGQQFLDQVCALLNCHEKYYFGLVYVDHKGDEDWLPLDKKVLKQDWPKGADPLEIDLRIHFYPMDVTQVLQYSTLYNTFLATKKNIVSSKLDVTGKDAIVFAALAFQAQRGDCAEAAFIPSAKDVADFLPTKAMADFKLPLHIKPADAGAFFAQEVAKVWTTLAGVLKHLAVLKYMQLAQQHRRFATQTFSVKNKKGTALTLGVTPHGLQLYRFQQLSQPIVSFSWAEITELSFAEKKFTVFCHDSGTRPFSVYTARAKACHQVLNLCVGLHQLYVQTMRNWVEAPEHLSKQRWAAAQAALIEREALKKEAVAVKDKAAAVRAQKTNAAAAAAARISGIKPVPPATAGAASAPPAGPPPAGPPAATPPTAAAAAAATVVSAKGEAVVVKGREKAVNLLDMMMADTEFMAFQDELLAQMEAEMDEDGDDYGDDDEDQAVDDSEPARWRCMSTAVGDRSDFIAAV